MALYRLDLEFIFQDLAAVDAVAVERLVAAGLGLGLELVLGLRL